MSPISARTAERANFGNTTELPTQRTTLSDTHIHQRKLAVLIGGRIRRQRLKLGLSLTWVAEAVGLVVSSLSYIETGQRNASLQVLVDLCRILSVPLDEVVSPESEKLVWKGPAISSSEGKGDELSLALLTDPRESRLAVVTATLPIGQRCNLAGVHGGVLTAVQKSGCSILRSGETEAVLRQGDAVTFRTRKPLTWLSAGNRSSTVLWVGRPGGDMRKDFLCT